MNLEGILQTIVISIFAVGLLAYAGITIYQVLHPQDNHITFEVVGIANYSQNASSLVNLHYECFKYCMDEINTHGGSRSDCWDECAKMVGCDDTK